MSYVNVTRAVSPMTRQQVYGRYGANAVANAELRWAHGRRSSTTTDPEHTAQRIAWPQVNVGYAYARGDKTGQRQRAREENQCRTTMRTLDSYNTTLVPGENRSRTLDKTPGGSRKAHRTTQNGVSGGKHEAEKNPKSRDAPTLVYTLKNGVRN